MNEKLKSFFLVFLIALSLYLTYQLWYGQRLTEESGEAIYERVVVENPRPLTQVLVPAKVLINREGSLYSLQESGPSFSALWIELSTMLQDLEYVVYPEPASELDPSEACIRIYFRPYLPVGSDQPWIKGASQELVEHILISCAGDRGSLKMIYADNEEAVTLSLQADTVEKIEALIAGLQLDNFTPVTVLDSDMVSAAAAREIVVMRPLVIPDDQITMTILELIPEEIDRELILKTFFINPGLVRTVEERDGGFLFTDGERGLRIIGHSLEYSYPLLESTQVNLSYSDALKSSSSYISYHGGWASNLRLESISPGARMGSRFFQAQWRMYFQGYPAYSRRPVIAVFNDRGLLNYNRSIYKPVHAAPEPEAEEDNDETVRELVVAPWYEALSEAMLLRDLDFAAAQRPVTIDDFHLGYAVTGTAATITALPVWVVRLDGRLFLLQADTLSLIQMEDLL